MPLFSLVTVDGHDHVVIPTGEDEWEVSSASKPGTWHTVRRWGARRGRFACDCLPPRSRPRNRVTPCRHTRAAAASLGLSVPGAA